MAKVINSLELTDGNYVFTTPYATCSTDAAAAAKAATITPASNFSLETGARVAVKFANDNTAGSPTLNVNSTGAKPIYFKNAELTYLNYWSAGQIVEFIYDGTNWVCSAVVKDNDTHWSSSLVSTNSSGGLTNAAADPTSGAGYLYLNLIENSIVRNSHKIEGSGLTKVTADASGNITINSSLSSWDTSEKLFLIGTTSQSTAVTSTGSHDTVYIGADGCLTVQDPDIPGLSVSVTSTGFNMTNPAGSYEYGLPVPDSVNTATIALTSDIPDVSNFVSVDTYMSGINGCVSLTGNQIIQGTKTFTATAEFNNGIATGGTDTFKVQGLYNISLPAKAGTVALTSDITDTKNTAGSTDTSSKIFLIGATSQAANPQTYSHDNVYVNSSGMLTNASASSSGNLIPVIRMEPDDFKLIIGNMNTNDESLNMHTAYGLSSITYYQGGNRTLSFPGKDGTIATTSDIPIKTATLSGTTLSITLS